MAIRLKLDLWRFASSLIVCAIGLPALGQSEAMQWPVAPPQDQGLPYTRSARPKGVAVLKDYAVAVFAGGRNAYLNGYKVRLAQDTPEHMLHDEAVLRDGKLLVPASFAGVLALKNFTPPPVPYGLKNRWVYDVPNLPATPPTGIATIDLNGRPYTDLAAAAEALGLKTKLTPRGLLLVSETPISYDEAADPVLADDIVTLFDTPDKLADPEIATKSIPLLKLQGRWQDHVKATAEELKLLEGPETKWPTASREEYDLSGFDAGLLGSAVPPPGVYPRLLFSEKDVPVILERMRANKFGQRSLIEWEVMFHKTWWDPKTSDGQIFQKLAGGDLAGLSFPPVRAGQPLFVQNTGTFAGQKPGLYNIHVNYVTNSLTSMALYCLLTNDEEHGKQAATAISNYYHLIEPNLEDLLKHSDSECGVDPDLANYSETGWRGMHGVVAHMDLPFALDFAGKFMTSEQRAFMQSFIARATYGRRDNMQAAPDRVKDVNHLTWHLTDFLAASAIEGLPGCDPELLEAGRESTKAFLDWGIDENGQIFESNGKNGGGVQFQILSMIVLARRGDNLWGHPHWRKLLTAQVYATSPNNGATVSSGTWGGVPFMSQATSELKAFFPRDRAADLLLTNAYREDFLAKFDAAAYKARLERSIGRILLPSPAYPGDAPVGIYNTDWTPTTRADLNLPLTWNDPVHGELSAATDNTEAAA